LPAIKILFFDFYKVMKAENSKVLEVVVAIVEEFINELA
jgi:hypothetical protein